MKTEIKMYYSVPLSVRNYRCCAATRISSLENKRNAREKAGQKGFYLLLFFLHGQEKLESKYDDICYSA